MERKTVERLLLCNYNKRSGEVVGVLPQELFGVEDEYVYPIEQLEAEVCLKGQKPCFAAVIEVMVDRIMGEAVKTRQKGKKHGSFGKMSAYVVRNGFVDYNSAKKKYVVKVISDGVGFFEDADGFEAFELAKDDVESKASFMGVSTEVAALLLVAQESEAWRLGRVE